MKIYTKSGDQGESALFGGERVSKDHPRLEAYGTLDELNAMVGWAVVAVHSEKTISKDVSAMLRDVQSRLFDLGAHLAMPPAAVKADSILPPLDETWTGVLETSIDSMEEELSPLKAFVLPGGTEAASRLHLARVVCRRAERAVVSLGEPDSLHPVILPYLNRLSDFFFVAARLLVARAGAPEVPWKPVRAQD